MLLATTTFPRLSAGFGLSVAGFTLACWLAALAFLCIYLEAHKFLAAFLVVFWAFAPVLYMADIATTSSLCDIFRNELNKKRLKSLGRHDDLFALEYALDRTNK
eukprot:COSAG02_NODE_127_length_34879_cov_12.705060_32_plen_104_part_00